VLALPQVEAQVLNVIETLQPFLERLDVHRAQAIESLSAQFRQQMAADETASATNNV